MKIQSNQNAIQYEDEVLDLNAIVAHVKNNKWLIVSLVFFITFSTAGILFIIPNEYKSQVLLEPADTKSGGKLASLASQFGGLAGLAGLDLDSGSSNKTEVAMKLIKTWSFLETFITENKLAQDIYAVKTWDKNNNRLIYDTDVFDQEKGEWVYVNDNGTHGPTSWELYEELRDRIAISKDKKSGIVSLEVEHFSPHVAKSWAEMLVKSINKHFKDKETIEAENSIKYLQEQIQKTNVADMQAIFYQLIEEQIKTLLLAEIGEEYLFKTLSPAMIAEEKSKPKRGLIIIAAFFLSLFAAFVIVFFKESYLSANHVSIKGKK